MRCCSGVWREFVKACRCCSCRLLASQHLVLYSWAQVVSPHLQGRGRGCIDGLSTLIRLLKKDGSEYQGEFLSSPGSRSQCKCACSSQGEVGVSMTLIHLLKKDGSGE
jgi:hypothetical protein